MKNETTLTTITQDEFEAQYKPIKNHVTQREEWNGWYFETYGEDEQYIFNLSKTAPNKIWTILDADGTMPIVSGMHHVNRFGYIVTQIPFDANNDIEVEDEFKDDEPDTEDDEPTEEETKTEPRKGFKKDYMKNAITWQAYMSMWVEMECLKNGKFPNGQTLTLKDRQECDRRIANATEILEHYNCQLPVLKDEPGDQLGLF